MNVLFLDYNHGYQPGQFATFASDTSCFDFDAVVWDPKHVIYSDHYRIGSMHLPSTYRGLPVMDESSSVRIRADIARRRAEFHEFVESGRILVVITRPPQPFCYDTGERSYSGTGKNQKATVTVGEDDVWKALPIPVKLTKAGGKKMSFVGPSSFAELWSDMRSVFRYEAVIEGDDWRPVLTIDGTNKKVGAVFTSKSGGAVILIPAVDFPDENDSDEEEEEDDLDEDDDVVELDDDVLADVDASDEDGPASVAWRFQSQIRDLIEVLQAGAELEPLPEWSNSYVVSGEVELQEEVLDRTRQVETARAALASAQARLDALQGRKRLVTGTGTALEVEVRRVLEALGGDVQPGAPGRDDWIVTFPEGIAVVEVKGLNGSAAEKHAAQLEKWVANRLEETGQPAKGLLVVNGWRKTPLAERTKDVFPDQMLKYSKARGHCLATGLQLLGILQSVEAKPATATTWRKKIMTTSGVLKAPDDWQRILGDPSYEVEPTDPTS